MFTNNNDTSQPDVSKEASAPVTPPTGNENGQPLFAGKYKTPEELEKGYNESGKYIRDLTTKLKDYETKIPKAPEAYQFDFSANEELKSFNVAEDEQLKSMMPVFKELGLSQDQASKLVENFLKTSITPAPTAEDFKKVLGADAEIKIGRLQVLNSSLPEKDQQIFQSLVGDPQTVDFLYRYILPKNEDSSVPVAPTNNFSSGESSTALYQKAYDFKDKAGSSFALDISAQKEYERLMSIGSRQKLIEENSKK